MLDWQKITSADNLNMFNGLNVGSIIIDSDNKPGTRNLSILAFCYDENEKPLAGNKKEQAISIASSNNGGYFNLRF